MSHTLDYFNQQVLDKIESWPVDIVADYARLVQLLVEFGPALHMPRSCAMGSGPFELRPRGREGVGRALYCFVVGQRLIVLHAFIEKTQVTRQADIVIARRRMGEVRDG